MAKAADAYQHAADLGDTVSMIRLAAIVGPGDGVPVDFERAQSLLQKAVAAGGSNAGVGLVEPRRPLPHGRCRSIATWPQAADAYQHAADLGDMASMIRLAAIVGSGDGVPVDFERAKALLQKAIAAGGGNASWAWASLGDLYRTADAGHRDMAKAVDAYQHAIDLGDTASMIRLASHRRSRRRSAGRFRAGADPAEEGDCGR